MPFLRALRDKRGYETIYLLHWFRDGARLRSRVLHVFRTPIGLKVGQHPLDPSTRRALEQLHPDLEFDWRALLDTQQLVDDSPDARRPRGRRRPDEAPPTRPRPARDTVAGPVDEPAAEPPARPQQPPRLQIPATIEGASSEEQVAWLTSWFGRIRDEVGQRTQDPVRREALLALVDRLNPDAWSGEEGVGEGLRVAADALSRLSHVFARKRRRARRPRPAPGPTVS